jgi:hypothetical protein
MFDRLLRDVENGTLEVSPLPPIAQQPEAIHHGDQAVGFRDETGDHYYPGYGPNGDDEAAT